MDLLPAEASQVSMKKQGFRSLKLVNVDMDQPLDDRPFGADHGRLPNGLSYYVRSNSKPRMRAALALAVKVGSILEEEKSEGWPTLWSTLLSARPRGTLTTTLSSFWRA